ncbi:MAG: sigma-54 dependent transcriptional regulator [Clostridiales bacterium]|nr:sigma-54 dependent transcriptional regulator [Clostridiales bacterium]
MSSTTEIDRDVATAKMRLGIVGNAPALTGALERAVRVAPIDLSVLITGESGTGKEFFPKIIHQFSPRKHARYIAVNCGAIPEGTIDSELFGHEKGAFTGAVSSRNGYFEEADGGTIFLDEVAELPLTTQARLLRVLESGEFMKVGSSTVQKTNIRIVAATNVDMINAVRQGRFREDLYYRLSTVQISIPPLRDRGNDIIVLTRKFLSDFAERYHTPRATFDDSAMNMLLHYRWPGNVRQLKNVVEQIALFQAGNKVDTDILSPYLPDMVESFAPVAASSVSPSSAYDRERDMLFNMIFRLQNEIDDLRSQLSTLHRPHLGEPAITPHVDMGSGINATTAAPCDVQATSSPVCSSTSLVKLGEHAPLDFSRAHPAASQPIDQVKVHEQPIAATLEETEKETIKRALERNMGRRRNAAAELNISERTLYRKIKEYNLE